MTQLPTSTYEPLPREALSRQIAARLLELIKEGALRSGERLPPERELAGRLQVSRASLREALQALSLLGVIEVRQGAGSYVTSLEADLLTQHLALVFSLGDTTLEHLFEARRAVEPAIAAIAAGRISDEELEDLGACLERSIAAPDRHAFLEADLELHELVVKAAGNPLLARFMESVSVLGLASRRETFKLPGITEQSLADHRAIVSALRDRDPGGAHRAMLDHLRNIEQRRKDQRERR